MKIIQRFEVEKIIGTLKQGGLVIYPTETVYGVGVDVTNARAVEKLLKYKDRPLGKPFSVAVADQAMAREYVDVNSTAETLYKTFTPGPITIVSTGKHKVAPGIESENGTLGIRIPDYPPLLELVLKFGKPITATSANASYKKRPYKIADILDNLSDKQKSLIDLIIDVGELPKREPSTVIDTTLDDITLLRMGDVAIGTWPVVHSRGEENTMNVAKELWQKYEHLSGHRAIVFALQGEMGAGKTIFTKGLAKAMGIEETIASPTYSLNDQYTNPKSQIVLEHIDTWRMQKPEELEQLGLNGMITDKSVIAIEWADRVADVIRKYNEEAVVIWIIIEYGKKEHDRSIAWSVAK